MRNIGKALAFDTSSQTTYPHKFPAEATSNKIEKKTVNIRRKYGQVSSVFLDPRCTIKHYSKHFFVRIKTTKNLFFQK